MPTGPMLQHWSRPPPKPAIPRRCTSDERRSDARVGADLPTVRSRQAGGHANRCLPVLLRMRTLQGGAAPEARRLLRVLFVRLREGAAGPVRAVMLTLQALAL